MNMMRLQMADMRGMMGRSGMMEHKQGAGAMHSHTKMMHQHMDMMGEMMKHMTEQQQLMKHPAK